MNDAEIRLLLVIADSLERQVQGASAGLIRRAARELAERPTERRPGTCLGCGVELVQPQHAGRRRKWCGKGRCVARRIPENSTLAAS